MTMSDVHGEVRPKVGDGEIVTFKVNVAGEIESKGAYGKLDDGLC